MDVSEVIPLATITSDGRRRNFLEKTEENPCLHCSAPCCRMLLIPHPTPSTFMELDYVRYMLGFPGVEMILNSDGSWQVKIEQTCRFLDPESLLCSVHNTPRKPKTCVFFNPHHCWYRRNFTQENPPDLICINREGFEAILPHVRFDEDDSIVEIPTWESIITLVTGSQNMSSRNGSSPGEPHVFPDGNRARMSSSPSLPGQLTGRPRHTVACTPEVGQ